MFLKVVVDEPESRLVQQELARHDLVSSRLLEIEARRVVARRGVAGLATVLERALTDVALVNIDVDITDAASRIGPVTLRSLDAIHLATAVLTPRVDLFCCHDPRLADAGRAIGLNVVDFR